MPVRAWPTITIGGTTSACAISGCCLRHSTSPRRVDEVFDDLAGRDLLAELVEVRLVAQRPGVAVETLAPGVPAGVVGAEVAEAGCLVSERDEPFGVEHRLGHQSPLTGDRAARESG